MNSVPRRLLVALLAILLGGSASGEPPVPTAPVASGARGPGLRGAIVPPLAVPAGLDLSHVGPAPLAVALGRDPVRIFEFVRDHVAFETYRGSLRGPRGTLLAMAGNSVDRAALLAGLLTEAGKRVRYARGTLSERDAADLVASMWAGETARPPAAGDAVTEAAQAFATSARHEFDRLRAAVETVPFGAEPRGPSPEDLLAEARTHWWVQVEEDGRWIDFDPSFADAVVGKTHAVAEETLPEPPAGLRHQVTVRVLAETSDGGPAKTTELLAYSSPSGDLSAAGLLLVHVPENWAGPVRDLRGGIGAAAGETGRVKPLLLVPGRAPVVGAPFRTSVVTTGLGGVGGLLGGAGTRTTPELATAEWIEFRFEDPTGRGETIVRGLFDLVGPARRVEGRPLTKEEVRAAAGGERTAFLRGTVYDLFFTTGRLDPVHLDAKSATTPPGAAQGQGSGAILGRLAVSFQLVSDALFRTMATRDGTTIRFYPDSPRVLVTHMTTSGKELHLTIDLRRDRVRVVTSGPNRRAAALGAILRGAVNGALEQALLEQVTAGSDPSVAVRSTVSTSLLLREAEGRKIPTRLVTREPADLDPSIPGDAAARLREEVRQGRYALVPDRPVEIRGVPRWGWWRIDPATGETVGVMDDGLHEGEYVLVVEADEGNWEAVAVTSTAVTPLATALTEAEMAAFVRTLAQAGWTVVIAGF